MIQFFVPSVFLSRKKNVTNELRRNTEHAGRAALLGGLHGINVTIIVTFHGTQVGLAVTHNCISVHGYPSGLSYLTVTFLLRAAQVLKIDFKKYIS